MGEIIYMEGKRLICTDNRVDNIFFYGSAPNNPQEGIKYGRTYPLLKSVDGSEPKIITLKVFPKATNE